MAKRVRMMILETCPHCKRAFEMMEELKGKNEAYKAVEFEIIDERKFPDIANALDYYYVPTYFVEDKKVFEGVPTFEGVEAVFKEALS